MNKTLNIIIFGLLALSIWAILSIGIGLIPLFNSHNFSNEMTLKINSVFINIAYSYSAGFIMYVLTVIIPNHYRKKPNVHFINRQIQDYYLTANGRFISYCNFTKTIEINDTDKKIIGEYKINYFNFYYKNRGDKIDKKEKENYDKVLENLYNWQFENPETKKLEYLKLTYEEVKRFIDSILPYFDFLSTEQMNIFNEIRKNGLIGYLDFYFMFINTIKKNEEQSLYDIFSKHDKLVESLYKTIGDYNKIKPAKKTKSKKKD